MTCLVQAPRQAGDRITAALLGCRFIVLTGPTGSGKTALLRRMVLRGAHALDLEALAAHRGSAFGALPGKQQPTPVEFVARVERYLRAADANTPIWVEDKGAWLGNLTVPKPLLERMHRAEAVSVRCEEQLRVGSLVSSYGTLPIPRLAKALRRLHGRLSPGELNRARRRLLEGDVEGAIRVVLQYYDGAYTRPLSERIIADVDVRPTTLDAHAEHLLQTVGGSSLKRPS